MNPWIMAGVAIAALVGGVVLLAECWRTLISGTTDAADEEGEAERAADARQAQAEKTGSYFPPEKSP